MASPVLGECECDSGSTRTLSDPEALRPSSVAGMGLANRSVTERGASRAHPNGVTDIPRARDAPRQNSVVQGEKTPVRLFPVARVFRRQGRIHEAEPGSELAAWHSSSRRLPGGVNHGMLRERWREFWALWGTIRNTQQPTTRQPWLAAVAGRPGQSLTGPDPGACGPGEADDGLSADDARDPRVSRWAQNGAREGGNRSWRRGARRSRGV